MRYDDVSRVMRKFVGCWEAFRKLGFPATDLFCLVANSARAHGAPSLFCQLRTQDKEFTVELGVLPSGSTREQISQEYERVATAVCGREIPQDDLDRMWQESEPYADPVGFTAALLAKGFAIRTKSGSN